MSAVPSLRSAARGVAALLLAFWPSIASAQALPDPTHQPDSVDIVAGAQYKAGGLHRFLFGNGYRDRWTTSIEVPVLDLHTFAGGLRPLKEGGGYQTKSLRLVSARGVEYAFRSVDKPGVMLLPGYEGTVVETVSHDQVSASDPAAALVAALLLQAAGVLHVTPQFFVMPDDPVLGEFRSDFAGLFGMLEEYPAAPKNAPGFAGAAEIIDSEELLALLDSTPAQRIDPRALLTARLMDMFLNDWDRHPDQWKWAQMRERPPTAWLPIPRDRDKAFVSYGGSVLGLARIGSPQLVTFDSTYPSVQALTWNSIEFDRRLLGGLERPAWDSVVAALVGRITDAVIDSAVRMVPPAYLSSAPPLAATLKIRRDGLPAAADRFYQYLAVVADIHATDADDIAVVTRVDDRFLDVQLRSGTQSPYFDRRFDSTETQQVRIYLHGGDDSALVVGQATRGIPVWIVGGNGTNLLVDSSLVGGTHHQTRLYDLGTVKGVTYGPDTLFNRRPWIKEQGTLQAPGPDRGGRVRPSAGFGIGDLGAVFGLGVEKVRFGFGRHPYASEVGLEAEYAAGVEGFRIGASLDHRLEASATHFTAGVRMSQLEVTNYYGIGNATPGGAESAFTARQQEWRLLPAVAFGVGSHGELSVGPVFQYTVTDAAAGTLLDATQPYGTGQFGQVGLTASLTHDARDQVRFPHSGLLAGLSGSVFPAIWDVTSTYGEITADGRAYVTVPVPLHPVLALRGSATKVFGDYPYSGAAFIGGDGSVRTLVPQRYAGDAALAGTAELRVPLATFPFVLPLNVGVFGFADAGRVYADGVSTDGWHTAFGGGAWIGIHDPATSLSITFTNAPGDAAVLIRAGFTF